MGELNHISAIAAELLGQRYTGIIVKDLLRIDPAVAILGATVQKNMVHNNINTKTKYKQECTIYKIYNMYIHLGGIQKKRGSSK